MHLHSIFFYFARSLSLVLCVFFFFFQAEDGIRVDLVTGVQTCALPICSRRSSGVPPRFQWGCFILILAGRGGVDAVVGVRVGWSGLDQRSLIIWRWGGRRGIRDHDHRSEERRVGKEGRSRWERECETNR